MTIKLRCDDYGFECEFILEELRNHFEEAHGIDYTVEAVIQMITNRGHSLESIRK
jgi:predicted small metal-binding protein